MEELNCLCEGLLGIYAFIGETCCEATQRRLEEEGLLATDGD